MFRHIVKECGRAAVTLGLLVGALALAAPFGDPLLAQAKKSDSKVKAVVKAGKPDADGNQTIDVILNIEAGWHLYANPVGNETFAEAKTIVTVSGKAKPRAVKITYPKGKLYRDEVLKEAFFVYEGQVTIPVQVQRAAGDTGPLQVMVQVNACDEKQCLQTGKINLTVP
jgi:DsbC/DsbD-like thiol-disulfide interchange protein